MFNVGNACHPLGRGVAGLNYGQNSYELLFFLLFYTVGKIKKWYI